VQDYPRPPALEPVPQRVWARAGGRVILETTRALRVLETHHAPTYYIPPGDIAEGVLQPGPKRRSMCEWKGRASYFDLVLDGGIRPDAAWTYHNPSRRFAALDGYVAFYATALDEAFVGSARVTPQAGDFYGGWITPNLRGLVKGAPGTEHW
jgi:uncharacterized protein (DUF427 family)